MNRKTWLAGTAAVVMLALAAGYTFSLQPALPARDVSVSQSFSSAELQRGEQLYRLGDCSVCHTRPGGARDAGGLPIATPFGTIYSTNITPDTVYGIGNWSYPAFVRVMRSGVNASGDYLYPAFPYTAFTHASDEDLHALYAWLMTRAAVHQPAPATRLTFPFSLRQGMALWNLLFLDRGALPAGAGHDAQWQRGRYLAEGLGHCSACHSPRTLFQSEKQGAAHFAGGVVDGWIAPALNGDSTLPWQEAELYDLLKTGFSAAHGSAAGPMAPVIAESTSQLADADLRAIAHYLASYQPQTAAPAISAATVQHQEQQALRAMDDPGARLFSGACMACHAQSIGADLHGVRPALQNVSQLRLAQPDNAIRVVLDGIPFPALADNGTMPAFRHNLNDAQIATLLNYLRQQLAGQPAWPGLEARVAAIRAQHNASPPAARQAQDN